MDSSGTTSGPPLRWYQQKCVEAAKGENLLVVLPTNSGKTRIAAELLDYYLTQWRCDSSASKKRKWCVLLTPTGPLADQQGLVLAQSCGLDLASEADDEDDAEGASHRLAIVRGQHTNRSKRAINAHNAWRRCATLVMTPALLVDSLIHARVVITDVVLLVLDEAHQLKGTSEYAILMKRFYSGAPAASRPRVLALTASPLSGRAPGKSWQPASEEDMKRELDELEEKVDCRTWTELGLVEAELLKTTVEERSFEMANSTERHKKLLEMIRSAKLEVSGNNRQRDQILRWNRTLERFEAEDGERGSIALELGEWATLRGLQLLCRGQAAELEEEDGKDEEKSNGEDEKVKNLEPEELICEARERLQGKLAQWQEKQTEKLHSSKALACIQKLRERFQADGGDMKCIVFTRTRALCQLLAMVLESEEGLPGVTYVVGGNDCRVSSWRVRQTATSQKQALAKFARPHNEEGAVSIVVATSVLAEGIDIPSCGLVLCFDSAVSPLQHVQLRGRARRARSEFTVLVPKGPKGPLGALATGPSLQQLKDYEVGVLNVLKAWSLRPSCPRPKLGPVSEEEVLEVNSSGARLPLEKAKNYLHVQVYGYLIPSEKSNEREILDFCKPGFRDNEKKYDYSMFQVKSSEQGWYSELELPPVGCCSMSLEEQTSAAAACDHSWWRKKEKPLCQEHLGMVVGPVVTQKGQAKDAAALRACRILHEMGILDDYLKVKGREKFQHLIKQATGSGKASGKRRSDDAIALASIETLERKLPRCLRLADTETELETFQLHRLVLGEHPGKHGLALLLPEKVPSGVTRFLLLPPGLEEPLQVEVQWLAEVEFSQQQLDDLKVWTQLSLELSCRRTCPLHQAFGQVPLTHFKDRSGRWVPATNAGAIGEDEDLPDRSYWLLAPMAPGSQAIHWDFVHWGLTSLNHLLQCESWQQMSACFVGETKTLHLDMSLSDAVVLGLMPTTQRGSDVRCLCVDLEVQDQSGLMKGYKFSRASVNAGVAPDFIKADRNLHQERLEIEFKADDCELIPLTLGQLQVLRSFPSLLWRLEFVALIQELQDGLLQQSSLNVLGEALTHSQVRSLPFELPNYRFCLERLELLGDAALKLMASVHCGSCLPTAKEGELSKAAQEFETNKWLRHASKASWDLAQYILLEAFRPKDLVAGLRRGTAPQKVVADAMEAVLGAVFRSAAASATGAALGTGIAETWRIFGALQKSTTDQSKIHLQDSFIPDFKDAALAALSSLRPTALTADELQSAKDAVLQATGYEFRRAELLGALRANASGSRSTSFERLEFLGDAVLQVLVSWHVMQLFPEFDEGELSDTQQALVCNYYISRKLVRNFDEASLLHVFFPGAQSPLRSPLRKYLKAVRGQEAGDFLVGEKSDLAAGLQRNDPGSENSRYKFIADAYEALMAAILLDTGGDLDQTWCVFAKDFDLSKVNVQEQIRGWRQHLREAEKKELIESGVLLPQSRAAESKPSEGGRPLTSTTATATEPAEPPAEPPVFGLLAKGEARRKLMEYCKRHQLKMKFDGSQEGDVFKSRVIVDGKTYMEGEGASSSAAQDLASEMALWQLQHPPQDPVPPVEVKGELPNAPGSIQAVERPKGLARKELQKYCNSVVQKFRFKELEVVQMDNSKMFQMQVVLGDRIFPKGLATTKPAAQDMAAELALLELRGGEELDQGASRPVGPSPAPPPPPPPREAQVTLPVPAERPKGIDRQELQFLCQRRGWTLTWQEQAEGPSHLRSFRASAVVHGVAYPQAQALTKNAAKDLAAFLALQSLGQAATT